MKLHIENFTDNVVSAFRSLGYTFMDQTPDGEWVFAKKISGGDYPRFHCYINKEVNNLFINLHLDQKRPAYEGTSRHAGEYEGTVVEEEAFRISRQISPKNR